MNIEARRASIDFHNSAAGLVQSDPQLAYRLLCSATTIDPTMASGWWMLGNATADLKMLPASIAAFRRCLQLPIGTEPGDLTEEISVAALINLGHRLFQNGEIDEAYEVTLKAIRACEAGTHLDIKNRAFAWTNMSLVLSIKGDVRQALTYAKKAFEMSQEPIIETGLGFGYLFAGDYAKGLKSFEGRFGYKLPQYLSYPYPRWDGSVGGRVFVASDQGLGDTISFTRFVPSVAERVDSVVFQVQPELVSMMAEAMRPFQNVEVVPQDTTLPGADSWVPVMSIPLALGLTTAKIASQPQIWEVPASTSLPEGWKSKAADLHIGIAYAGSPLNEIDRWRSAPLTEFLRLYDVPGIQLYSLQVGDRAKDIHDAGAAGIIRDMSPWIKDATHTAEIMRQLDLVITIDSFVGHLAGAMGKKCWTLVSRLGGDWRLGRSGDKPIWYPRTKLFRQGSAGTWGPVFDDVKAALEKMANNARGPARGA